MTPLAKSLAFAIVLLAGLTALSPAFAKCSHETKITNGSGIMLTLSELKSSSEGIFKSQWKGSRVIKSGATGTINWTSDANCKDNLENPNHWDIKLIRKNGEVHFCGGLAQSQPVRVNTPDLCFLN
jgi:hypothetical protein